MSSPDVTKTTYGSYYAELFNEVSIILGLSRLRAVFTRDLVVRKAVVPARAEIANNAPEVLAIFFLEIFMSIHSHFPFDNSCLIECSLEVPL